MTRHYCKDSLTEHDWCSGRNCKCDCHNGIPVIYILIPVIIIGGVLRLFV
jgi:hypothetical protein